MKLRMVSFGAGIALASVVSAGAVDDHVRRFMTFHMAPGVSVAVMKGGKVVFAKGFGKANLEANTRVSPNTVFKIASVSKQFIAAEILLLEQENKLKTDDLLSKYLSDLPDSWKSIRLRHLLSHTSGLAREEEGWEVFKNVPVSDIVRESFRTKMVAKPGEKYAYSNLGYFVLAHVIDKVSGATWDQYATKKIFEPSGLKRTMPASHWNIVPDKAMGYDTDAGVFENALSYYTLRPSGGFSSTALDMLKWCETLSGSTVLSEASKAKMWTPAKLNNGKAAPYGLGWEISELKGHLRISHDGGAQGFNAHIARYPNDDLAVVVLTNFASAPAEDLATNIASTYIKDLAQVQYATKRDEAPEKTKLLAKFLQSRTAEKPDPTITTSNLMNQMDWELGRLRFSRLGSLRSLVPVTDDNLPKPYTHRYLAKFDRITVYALANFDNGKIDLAGLVLP
jgi:D-alanyl-D-alanine carboxypeptidase